MGRPKLATSVAVRHVLSVRLEDADRARLDLLIRYDNERAAEQGLSGVATDATVVRALLRQACRARGLTVPGEEPAPPVATPSARPAKPRPAPKASAPAAPGGAGPSDEQLRAGVRKASEGGTSAKALWAAVEWNQSSGSRWLNEKPLPGGTNPQPMPPEVRAALVEELRRLGALE